MAYIQDSTQSFTITLTALLEGFGNIVYMIFQNLTQGVDASWDGITWSAPLEAVESDNIRIFAEIRNEGDTRDILFGEFVSAQVTPIESLIQEMPNVIVGGIGAAGWNFIMPPSAVNITINAGHVE